LLWHWQMEEGGPCFNYMWSLHFWILKKMCMSHKLLDSRSKVVQTMFINWEALYGLKQVPKVWNKKIDLFMRKHHFQKCSVEHDVYVKHKNDMDLLIMCIYIDDILITSSVTKIEDFKVTLMVNFGWQILED